MAIIAVQAVVKRGDLSSDFPGPLKSLLSCRGGLLSHCSFSEGI